MPTNLREHNGELHGRGRLHAHCIHLRRGVRASGHGLGWHLAILVCAVVSLCGIMFTCWMVGVHRLLVFLTIVSMIQGGGLILLGLQMMRLDLGASHSRTLRQSDRAEQEFQRLLGQANVDGRATGMTGKSSTSAWPSAWPSGSSTGCRGFTATWPRTSPDTTGCEIAFPSGILPDVRIKPIPELALAKSFAPQSAEQLAIQSVSVNFWNLLFMLGGGGLVASRGRSLGLEKSRRSATSKTSRPPSPPAWPMARRKFRESRA